MVGPLFSLPLNERRYLIRSLIWKQAHLGQQVAEAGRPEPGSEAERSETTKI